jgi:hypothetical protein
MVQSSHGFMELSNSKKSTSVLFSSISSSQLHFATYVASEKPNNIKGLRALLHFSISYRVSYIDITKIGALYGHFIGA